MNNLIKSSETKEFYVWIDLNDIIVKNNYKVGSFNSALGTKLEEGVDNRMFIPNPNFKGGFVSPFQANLLRNYLAEDYLETCRNRYYNPYPSRLNAIFLLENEDDALKYKEVNPSSVENRILKRVKSKNNYIISKHDSTWVDFLRLPHYKDNQTINNVCKAYWEGIMVKDCNLISLGKPWCREPIHEILYYGVVSFDKSYEAK